jgi:hypothetical protein
MFRKSRRVPVACRGSPDSGVPFFRSLESRKYEWSLAAPAAVGASAALHALDSLQWRRFGDSWQMSLIFGNMAKRT